MNLYLRVVSYVKPYWHYMAGAILCMVCFAALSSATVWIALPLLQTLFGKEAPHESVILREAAPAARLDEAATLVRWRETLKERTNRLIAGRTNADTLKRLCVIVFIVVLLKNLCSYFQAYLMAYAELGVIRDLRNALYTHLHRLSLSYFHQERTGELISRITYDVNLVNGTISAAFGTMVKEPLLVLVHLALLVLLSWQLTLAAFLFLPLSVLVITKAGQKLRRSSTASQETMADLTSTIQETVAGIRVVKAFGMEGFETTKFIRQTGSYFRTLLRLTRTRNLAGPVTEVLGGLVGLAILWYGGSRVMAGDLLAPEDFLTFLLALFSMLKPLKELGQVNNRIQEGIAAAERVFAILDTPPSIVDAPGAIQVTGFRESIRFRDVSFGYDGNREVLQHIDLTVRAGEILAIVGPSGGGKSTLVDLVARFYDPTDGTIQIDGVDLHRIRLDSLRGLMGIVTQEVILFNDTVRNNIAYGLADIPLDRVIEAAVAANADEFIRKLPDGYDTWIGERGVRLSGGQRQRLAIARAILKDPHILIFDEATSALDTESELLVQEAIDRLMRGRTAFVIAHRLSTIQHADRVIVIDDGRIVQTGTHATLVQADGLYRKLYALQFRQGSGVRGQGQGSGIPYEVPEDKPGFPLSRE
ncbi:MAG: ABC transporter ATP-binding protein [Candidatus Latescibacteria bacterium]|nr:ABC transporter ATP-binding protein [Candidatus Latescibacterota bacterium]